MFGQQPVAGDDGWGMRGCVVSQDPFALRLRWSNTRLFGGDPAQVTYRLTVVAGPGGCDVVEEEVGRHGTSPSGAWPPTLVVIGAGGLVISAAAVWAALRLARPKPLPKDTVVEPGKPGAKPR